MNDSEQVFEVPPSEEPVQEMVFDDDASVKSDKRRGPWSEERKQRARESRARNKGGPQVITQEQLESTVIGLMQTMGALFDESFEVLDPQTGVQDPRVSVASAQMLPWAQKYGGTLLASAPWLGLAAGCMMLLGPGLGPTIEMVSGVRKPRILRQNPADIYTERYKQAAQQVVNGQLVKPPEQATS